MPELVLILLIFFHYLFFTKNFLNLIVEQTNSYALQNNKIFYMNYFELLVFQGRLLLSSQNPLPKKGKYWSLEDNVPKILSNSTKKDRFENILRNIHLVDKTTNTKNDRSFKLRPLFQHMQTKILDHDGLEEHMSIDESMISYYGKHYSKQFIRDKPIRFRFKCGYFVLSMGTCIFSNCIQEKVRHQHNQVQIHWVLG